MGITTMNPPPIPVNPHETPRKNSGCLLYAGIFIAMFLFVFFSTCVVTYVMPIKFESTAVIQIKLSQQVIDGAYNGTAYSPQFFATEFEVITATMTLRPVVQKLDLTNQWSMVEEDAITLLKRMTVVNQLRGTDLIQIRVRDTDPERARDIAREIILSYKKRREDTEREMVNSSLQELDRAIQQQSEVVEERRKYRDDMLEKRKQLGLDAAPANSIVSDAGGPDKLERMEEMLDLMREKLAELRIDEQRTIDSVILHEEPVIAQYPCSPNVSINLAIGACLGIILGAISVWLVRLIRGAHA